MKKSAAQPLFLLICLLLAGVAHALTSIGGASEELLDPAQAFDTSASVDDDRNLLVRINIAEGYYLYRKKIKITSASAKFNELILPDGTRKTDEFFGEVETYRGMLDFSSKIEDLTTTDSLSITIQSQGCADIGICYPPFTQKFIVEVPAAAESDALPAPTLTQTQNTLLSPFSSGNADVSASSSVFTGLGSNSGTALGGLSLGGDEEILDPEIAFKVLTGEPANGSVPVTWQIADGYYMYRDKFKFEVLEPTGGGLGNIDITAGKMKHDEFFGDVEVNRTEATAIVSLANLQGADQVTLKVGYQGCADLGVCFPPQSKEFQIAIVPAMATAGLGNTGDSDTGNSNGTIKVASIASAANTNLPMAEQDRLAASLGSGNRWLTILTFFGMGILLTFTPCVLPMIPILSSIIVGNGEKIGTGRAFTLSLIYVLAMALTYTVAGVVIGLTGENIQATLQHPFVLSAFAVLFVILAASMFGLFEIQMPAFVQNRLTNVSNKQKSGSFGGVATMGFLSALIVGPCVTAPLVGALIYIGQTGDAVLGGAALFALSMGMGIPLLIIGTSFGKYLPTAGPWMDVIKNVFGVMLLGVAIWMLDRVIPTWATMALFALLLIVVGMFMGAFDNTPADTKGWRKITKGFGYASLVYGTLLIIGVATGNGTLLKPLNGLTGGAGQTSGTSDHVEFQQVKGIENLEAALSSAQARNKPVILDFYADWCVSCKEMEAFTFTDPKVSERMNRAVLLQADVTVNDEMDKALLKKYGIFGPPAIIFYGVDGAEQKNARVVGFMAAEKFANHLDLVL